MTYNQGCSVRFLRCTHAREKVGPPNSEGPGAEMPEMPFDVFWAGYFQLINKYEEKCKYYLFNFHLYCYRLGAMFTEKR